MSLSAALACLIVLIFAVLGVAKIMAPGPMPQLAGLGLSMLLAGAVITHVRKGDQLARDAGRGL